MGEPVTRAYVNHGRWVIECACRSASEAVRQPQQHPWAATHHQAKVGVTHWQCPPEHGGCGVTSRVIWPAPDTRRRIFDVLRHRPKPSNMNWHPGEPVSALVAENLEHGCRVPEGEAAA